jgi:hypothetical protein
MENRKEKKKNKVVNAPGPNVLQLGPILALAFSTRAAQVPLFLPRARSHWRVGPTVQSLSSRIAHCLVGPPCQLHLPQPTAPSMARARIPRSSLERPGHGHVLIGAGPGPSPSPLHSTLATLDPHRLCPPIILPPLLPCE